jgi:hypothetical protein
VDPEILSRFDDVEIVEQPFPGRCNPAVRPHVLRQQVVNLKQETAIVGQSRQKPVPRASGLQPMHVGKDLTVLFHLIGAEQLRSEGQFIGGEPARRATATEPRPRAEKTFANGSVPNLHVQGLLLVRLNRVSHR